MGQTLWKKKTTMKHNECLGKIRWPQIQWESSQAGYLLFSSHTVLTRYMSKQEEWWRVTIPVWQRPSRTEVEGPWNLSMIFWRVKTKMQGTNK
jgi:hypothetical protein